MLENGETYNDLYEFANDVNKALHAQVREKEKILATTEAELTETKERIDVMQGHLESVKIEQVHTQRLVDAKIKEIETENHLKQLAERERGRFHAEFKRLSDEMTQLQASAWTRLDLPPAFCTHCAAITDLTVPPRDPRCWI